jgi:hypothetical protein
MWEEQSSVPESAQYFPDNCRVERRINVWRGGGRAGKRERRRCAD